MSYLSTVRLVAHDWSLVTPKEAFECNIPVTAFDVSTMSVLSSVSVKRVIPHLGRNFTYFSMKPVYGERLSSLQVTMEHPILADISGKMDIMEMGNLVNKINDGAEVHLYVPKKGELNTFRKDTGLVTMADFEMPYPASFSLDVELEKLTQIPLVTFDSGKSFYYA